jgi:phage tail-like protein
MQAASMLLPFFEAEEAYAGHRFFVLLNGLPLAIFTECNLPTMTIETMSVKEGGQNQYIHKLPTRNDMGTLRLKYGLSRNGLLFRWYLRAVTGNYATATGIVTVWMVDPLWIPLAFFHCINALPTKWNGPNLRAGDSAVAIEELEISFQGFMYNEQLIM